MHPFCSHSAESRPEFAAAADLRPWSSQPVICFLLKVSEYIAKMLLGCKESN